MKICKHCGESKDDSHFYKQQHRFGQCYSSGYCKKCTAKRRVERIKSGNKKTKKEIIKIEHEFYGWNGNDAIFC